jgi:hypothetical protein
MLPVYMLKIRVFGGIRFDNNRWTAATAAIADKQLLNYVLSRKAALCSAVEPDGALKCKMKLCP